MNLWKEIHEWVNEEEGEAMFLINIQLWKIKSYKSNQLFTMMHHWNHLAFKVDISIIITAAAEKGWFTLSQYSLLAHQ